MYLCLCYGVTEKDTRALANDDVDYATVVEFLKAEGKCCKCLPRTKEIFDEEKHTNTWEHRAYGTPTFKKPTS